MSSRNVWHLHPDLRLLAAEWAARCSAEGLDIIITCTYRSNEEQAALYAEGRTDPGKIKTWAKPGQSKHNLTAPDGSPAAEAFDFVPMRNGKCVWGLAAAEDRELWSRCVAIARELGLRCGADWPVRKRDWPHLELIRAT